MLKETPLTKTLRIEVLAKMLSVQTEECKNCRLVFEEVGLKSQFHNQEINQYPDDIKGTAPPPPNDRRASMAVHFSKMEIVRKQGEW